MTPIQPSSNRSGASVTAAGAPSGSVSDSVVTAEIDQDRESNTWASANKLPRRAVPAWLFSFLFHVVLAAICLLLLTQFQKGGGDVETRSGGIVLVDATEEATEYLDEGDVEAAAESAAAQQAPAVAELVSDAAPELPGVAASEPAVAASDALLGDLVGADSMLTGSGQGGEIGGPSTTEIFGIQGTGTRFVYVVDHSQSMSDFNGRTMQAAKQQLLKSIASLRSNNQFQIVFYNNQIRIFNPDGAPTMYHATNEFKQEAKRFVDRTRPDGGTDHMNALKYAFRLRPDVIFLLTDAEGGFSKGELRDLSDWNRSGAVINAIEFGIAAGRDRSLEQASRESGGSYLFKNINTLKLEGE